MPRDCPAERDWHAWLDGELDSDRSRPLRKHLAGCRDCQAIHARELGLTHALAVWEDERVPAALTASLLQAARSPQPAAARGTARQWATVLLLASALALSAHLGRAPAGGAVDWGLLLDMAVDVLHGFGLAVWRALPRVAGPWVSSWPGVWLALVAGLGLGAVTAGLNALWARNQWG